MVVKSVSVGRSPPSEAFSQVHASASTVSIVDIDLVANILSTKTIVRESSNLPAGRAPHEQSEPLGVAFSVAARSQVHSPAGRAPVAC